MPTAHTNYHGCIWELSTHDYPLCTFVQFVCRAKVLCCEGCIERGRRSLILAGRALGKSSLIIWLIVLIGINEGSPVLSLVQSGPESVPFDHMMDDVIVGNRIFFQSKKSWHLDFDPAPNLKLTLTRLQSYLPTIPIKF